MYEEAFNAREDLKKYENNALLLFSLILRFGIDDIDAVASDSLTDSPNDKKADLVYVNSDEEYAIIAQSYMCQDTTKKQSAPSNKAADLNIAVTWLLTSEIEQIPDILKSAALQLRSAINDNEIKRIELWYVHNLPESINCSAELDRVVSTLDAIVKRRYPDNHIDIVALEIGEKTLNEWYQSIKTPILVNEEITIPLTGGYRMSTSTWDCFSTSLPCVVLFELFKKYDTKLFSANIRDYLGSKRSDSNINYGIKKSIETEPENFWIYNNGITVMTHQFEYDDKTKILKVKGFSIVNGAQTTGSIGSISKEPDSKTCLPARFVKCNTPEIISNIVRYNNSQNKITAADFRSNDRIQERLREEFKSIPNTLYTGGRRGGANDAINRNPNILPSDSVAQSIAAFHMDPAIAYNKKSEIWRSDRLYSNYFNEKISAKHICLIYSLFLTVMNYKSDLNKRFRIGERLLDADIKKLNFLRLRGANYIFMTSISNCMETLINKPIADKFKLHFSDNISPNQLISEWEPIVSALLSLSHELIKPTENSLKNESDVKSSLLRFKSLVEATVSSNKEIYEKFSSKIKL